MKRTLRFGCILLAGTAVSCGTPSGTGPQTAPPRSQYQATAPQSRDPTLVGAVSQGDVSGVRALLANGANVNARDSKGWTALMLASYLAGFLPERSVSYQAIVRSLLDGGADVNAKTYGDGMTALMLASFTGTNEVASALLAKGADVNAKSNGGGNQVMPTGGESALMLASKKDHRGMSRRSSPNVPTSMQGR